MHSGDGGGGGVRCRGARAAACAGHDGHDAQHGGHADHGVAGQGADHMQHSFADAERYAKSFDDPARDAWQMPDRVIGALALKPGQVVTLNHW